MSKEELIVGETFALNWLHPRLSTGLGDADVAYPLVLTEALAVFIGDGSLYGSFRCETMKSLGSYQLRHRVHDILLLLVLN